MDCFAFQKPVTHPVTESEILQFIAYFGAIVVTIFFWGILANTLSMLFAICGWELEVVF